MTTRHTSVTVCNRCDEDIEHNHYEETVGNLRYEITPGRIRKLYYMIKQNGSGSARSDMSLDLCNPCTKKFLAFMKNA